MVGLGFLPDGGFWSEARGVSSDGSVIVGCGNSASGMEAFLWDDVNGMRNLRTVLVDSGLDLTDWQLTSATGISADGLTIVGYGTNPSGQTEGWIATNISSGEPIPEPSTIVLFSIGGFSILAYVWRRRKRSA